MAVSTDQIEKPVNLMASQARVWHAISDAQEFGRWFGAEFEGAFVPGAHLTGKIVPTHADETIANMQEPYRGMAMELFIEKVEPPEFLSFRWHPYAVDPDVDYSNEPTTLVELRVIAEKDGSLLIITESGFDQLPPGRRDEAYQANLEGWTAIQRLLKKHLQLEP